MGNESVFLSVAEVAEILGVSRPRAYGLAAAGVFPSVRLSERRIRIPRRAFEAWLDDQSDRALASVRTQSEAAQTA